MIPCGRIDAKMAEQQTQISHEIFRHLRVGDSKDVFKFIDSHSEMDINVQNEDGETMLIYCVKRLGKKWTLPFGGEHDKICESLIKRNMNVNLQDLKGNTAAHCAVDLGLVEVLKLLLRNGARLGIPRRTDSMSALDLIAEIGDLDWTRGIFAETVTVEEHVSNQAYNRDLKQTRTATAVNKQLNFTLKNKLHTTNYIYCIFEAYFMMKSV